MDTNFSTEMKTLLESSHREAVRHNNRVVKVEHILLAILSDNENLANVMLRKLIAADTMYRIRDGIDRGLFAGTNDDDRYNVTVVSDLANRIIKLSVLEARILKAAWLTRSICFWPYSTTMRCSRLT